jgi:hypothetical protein
MIPMQIKRFIARPARLAEYIRAWPQSNSIATSREDRKGCTAAHLPAEIKCFSWSPSSYNWSDMERAGIVRLGDDWLYPFLRPVLLPAGWSLDKANARTAHLLDSEGRVRAYVYAFGRFRGDKWVDESAFLEPSRRFEPAATHVSDFAVAGTVYDRDTEKRIFQTPNVHYRREYDYHGGDFKKNEAIAWLDTNYPHWRDPHAYRGGQGDPALSA